jgi:hypothetical protein
MSAQPSYKAMLSHKLDQLNHQRFTVLERWELLSWYGRERVTNVVWRDIKEVWESLDWSGVKGGAPEIKVIKTDETTSPQKYILVRADSLQGIGSFI